jgi:predicted ATPase
VDNTEPPQLELAAPEAQSKTVKLSELNLDPNNYRFRHEDDYVDVPEDRLCASDVQRRTTKFILGEKEDNVRDLLDSFKRNGWLPVDQIQVRKLGKNKYLVVEGNRRVASLKHLERRYQEGAIDLGRLKPEIFDSVPVNLYPDADDKHHMVLAALKHISGNKKWPPLNQARLLAKLRYEERMSADDVCQSVGISKNELTRSLRALALCEAYRESDYGQQFSVEKFNLFREITNAPRLRSWLGWDDAKQKAGDTINLEKLFSLISREDVEDDDGEAVGHRDAAITTATNVREFTKIVEDPKALARLEETRSLTEATLASNVVLADRVQKSLTIVDNHAMELFKLLPYFEENDLHGVQTIIDKFSGLLAAKKQPPRIIGKGLERLPFQTVVNEHFSEIQIERWRGFTNVELKGLRRINIFGGINNAGKTSLLEAIHVLSQQADVEALFEVVARRGKVTKEIDPKWFLEQVPEHAQLSGTFDTVKDNETSVTVDVDRSGEGLDDKTFYLGSVVIESAYAGRKQWARTNIFSERRDRQTESEGDRVLCRAILSSPFSMHDPTVLVQLHKRSVETKSKERILEFIRETIDSGVLAIDLVDELKGFLISHRDFDRSPDLTQFGEGLQRIFHIALLFAYAEHGIVLIDEVDNAIHVGLLKPLVRFLHELAIRFNTQVFITTHSKECIQAWVETEGLATEVTYFGIGMLDGKRFVRSMPGEKLAELIEIADIDPRWVR